ncbi:MULTISPECIES: hypothetical protein [unclassified Pseudoclavibacter]|uniref:hypothetical protein n=1 Tax=unclassified Pseudoclavibacter TaxID=2615177 RepID=UPI0011B076EA|nr:MULTISPECIES: hypothetical protein [unclassified Pseudoclavibacter]MBS3177993.1 hypothetical protein [Pseudoclavibacter sp. Marseille-Q4354]
MSEVKTYMRTASAEADAGEEALTEVTDKLVQRLVEAGASDGVTIPQSEVEVDVLVDDTLNLWDATATWSGTGATSSEPEETPMTGE